MYCNSVYNIVNLSLEVNFMKDLRSFCDLFYAAHYLPIALYDEAGFVCAAGFPGGGDPYPFVRERLAGRENPAVYVSSDTGCYGLVRCDSARFLVLGPVYSTPVTGEIILAYQNKNAVPPQQRGEIAQFLCGIPSYTYNQFLNMLLYLLYTLTGERKNVSDAFSVTDTNQQEEIRRQHTQSAYENREDQRQHGSYHFERQRLSSLLIFSPRVANLAMRLYREPGRWLAEATKVILLAPS